MDKKIKILFVDDEPRVIDGLRRMLHTMRAEWEMVFVNSGREALDLLAKSAFDVIVSDMKMPQMDGHQLLSSVRAKYPQVVRIALSGQTSKEAFLGSVGPIHQFLSKPCTAETLKNTIARACSLGGLHSNENLMELTSSLESLPSLPMLCTELLEELKTEEPSTKKISQIISQDMGMSVKILQLVNSSYFGVKQSVSSISQAINFLGLDTIKTLIISAKIFSQFQQTEEAGVSLKAIWDHSMTVTGWARLIAKAEKVGQQFINEFMLSGMLHDVGKLVLVSQLPEEYERVLALSTQENLPFFIAESKVLGVSHAEVGAYLLSLWGFSHDVAEAAGFHHNPVDAGTERFSPLTAVYAANMLEHEIDSCEPGQDKDLPIADDYLCKLGLLDRWAIWRQSCLETLAVKC
ncbi:MAG: HDOD domain-containing protein [Sedimentisphaerales bacterium]|nr:HDOD domain-containing protein [Sedimentisphaerales bacterium]